MNTSTIKTSVLLGISSLVLSAVPVSAYMSSTNYEILFDSFSRGGDDTSSSTSYELRDTLGNFAVEHSSSTNYYTDGGYREGIFDPVATFQLHVVDKSTQVAATGISTLTITVTSTADYAEGDRVVVVQDEGDSQIESTGVVASLTATTLTLDELRNTPLAIDGVDDYVYNMNGSAVNLGVLSESAVSTGIVGWTVDSYTDEGYGVYVYEDEDLNTDDGLDAIPDVADGAVTAGSAEYGAISDDGSLALSTFDTQDTGFTGTPQLVGSRPNFSGMSMNHLLLKASTDSAQRESTYGHNLIFYYVGDY